MKSWKLATIALCLAALPIPGCGKGDAAKSGGASQAAGQGGVQWYDYETGMAKAAAEGKYVVIDFWTGWCHWCKVLDEKTYSQEIVQKRLAEKFIAIKVNAESQDAQGKSPDAPSGVGLARMYGVNSYPTTWFLNPQGQPISPLPGFVEAPQFSRILDYVSTGAYLTEDFQAYMAAGDGQ